MKTETTNNVWVLSRFIETKPEWRLTADVKTILEILKAMSSNEVQMVFANTELMLGGTFARLYRGHRQVVGDSIVIDTTAYKSQIQALQQLSICAQAILIDRDVDPHDFHVVSDLTEQAAI